MKRILLYFVLLMNLNSFASPPDSGKFKRLIPSTISLQFAGNIGFMSSGFGYKYAKQKMDLDLLYGYVPKNLGGPLHCLTVKNTYTPFKSKRIFSVNADVLIVGIPLSYTLGKEYFFLAPKDQYPSHYYDYSSALRIGIFVGSRIIKQINSSKLFNDIAMYYELGTYDLMIHNYYYNIGTVSFVDIFNLGIGMQFRFQK